MFCLTFHTWYILAQARYCTSSLHSFKYIEQKQRLCAVIETFSESRRARIEEIWGERSSKEIYIFRAWPLLGVCKKYGPRCVYYLYSYCPLYCIHEVSENGPHYKHTCIQRESTICKHDFKSSCKETFVEWKFLYLQSTFNGHVSEQRANKAKVKEGQTANYL